MKVLGAVMVCIGLSTNVVQADFQTIGKPEGLLLGAAVGVEYSSYKQTEQPSSGVMPYIAYEWENLHIGIDDVAYEFFDNRTLTLTASVEPRWSFADTDDSPIFAGIERDTAIEVGLLTHYEIQQGLVSTWYVDGMLLQDVSGVYNGQEVELAFGFNREFAKLEFDVSAGATYHSKGLNQYLYGVTTQEANATSLVEFIPNSSVYPFIDMSVQIQMWGPSLFVINVSSEFYNSDLQKSPLLDKAVQTDIVMGIVAQF